MKIQNESMRQFDWPYKRFYYNKKKTFFFICVYIVSRNKYALVLRVRCTCVYRKQLSVGVADSRVQFTDSRAHTHAHSVSCRDLLFTLLLFLDGSSKPDAKTAKSKIIVWIIFQLSCNGTCVLTEFLFFWAIALECWSVRKFLFLVKISF